VTIENDILYRAAETFAHDRDVAPLRRRRDSWRRRWHVAAYEDEAAPDEQFRRPGGEGDCATRLEDAQHFSSRHLGPRRKHVAELAEDDIKLRIRKGQRFGVAFAPIDLGSGDTRVLPRALK